MKNSIKRDIRDLANKVQTDSKPPAAHSGVRGGDNYKKTPSPYYTKPVCALIHYKQYYKIKDLYKQFVVAEYLADLES